MKTKVCVAFLLLISMAASILAVQVEQPLKIVSSTENQIFLRLQTPELESSQASSNGEDFTRYSMTGASTTAEDGFPELPIFSTTLAIPARGSFELDIRPGAYYEISGAKPYPVIPDGTNPETFVPNRAAYESSSYYPQNLVMTSDPAIIRDFRVISLVINPMQWQASSGNMRVYTDLELEIRFTDNPGINELPAYTGYSPSFEKLYSSIISNFEDYRISGRSSQQSKILLVYGQSTDPVFQSQLADFVKWKQQKGHDVTVVSTAVTGTSNTAIKAYIQNLYNNIDTRPDFIILLGDTNGTYSIPAFSESVSGYGGGGDYPYTHLAGSDLLGDVFIGRISAENLSQLTVLFSKIYAYEKNIDNNPASASWLDRMVLIGDPSSSGVSTINVNKYIKEMAIEVNPDYDFIENYSGGFSSTMNSAVNVGVSFFNYRGYIGMSGWSPSSSLINGAKMPHATILTCSTGNYYNGTGTTESFMRLGTSTTPAGAITATGMSTSGTHTMFNNSLNGGIYEGIFTYKMRTMGEALLNGKLFLANIYSASNPNQVTYFSHWCNLMGDPTVEVFVGIPGNLNIAAEPSVPVGTNLYDISVTDDMGVAVEDVSVTIWSESMSTIVAKGFTNEYGLLSLVLPGGLTGECTVTVSKPDFKPTQTPLVMDGTGSLVYSSHVIVDDGSQGSTGNGNGFGNAGETIALMVDVLNSSANAITGISGTLSCSDPAITITSPTSAYSDLNSMQVATNQAAFLISIDSNIEPQHDSRLDLHLTDTDGNEYTASFHLSSFNAALEFSSYDLNSGGNNILDPAENGILQISVQNNGNMALIDVYGELTSLNDFVQITDASSYFGAFGPMSSTSSTDGFGFFARAALVVGMQIPFSLRLYNDQGFEQTVSFNIMVGTPNQNTPLGPDSYGYFIYDDTDEAYPDCPTYEWIEIHPGYGGSGTQITGFNDSGSSYDEGDQVGSVSLQTVDLPFPFSFYGIEYDQITVCTNGFIAMGQTSNAEFRNYRLPGAMGPSPMIAAFWDDMALIQDAGIYKYYNADEHYFIIQYHKMRNGYNLSSEETFQVIFYDPLFYPTGLGDGMIKIQYKVFNNIDTGGGGYTPVHGNYATIGIKDHTNTQGLEYTYNNTYPLTASPLGNQRAILITTEPVLHENAHLVVGELIVNDLNSNGIVEPGEEVELGVKLNNIGLNPATGVAIAGTFTSPYVSVINGQSSYQDIPGSDSGINMEPIRLLISEDCPDLHTVSMLCDVDIDGNAWQYSVNFTVRKPAISISNYYINDEAGNHNGLADPGEALKIVVNYENNSPVAAKNLTSYLNCLDANVQLVNVDVLIPQIPSGATVQAVYDVILGENVQMGNFITFYVTYLGDLVNAQNQQIMLSVGETGMSADFEMNNGDFIAAPPTGGWAWGGSAYAGAHSGVAIWGNSLNGNYPANQTSTLISPEVYIGSNYVLEFWHRYNFEPGYDGGNVKISQNNGSTWMLLEPEGGYPQAQVTALGEPGYSSSLANWSLARFDLSAYSNRNVRFKWTLAADGGVESNGWYIDDVSTSGYIDFAAVARGTVECGNPQADLREFMIANTTNNITVSPNTEGDYAIYLPVGSYALTASGPGYEEISSPQFTLSLANPVFVQDFYLGYYAPVHEPEFQVIESQLILSWQAPLEPQFDVLGYNVYRKINAGRYELLTVSQTEAYSETLSELGSYEYYIEAKYAGGNSAPSEVISFSYPYVDGSEEVAQLPTTLFNNYPNPFNPTTTIRFNLKQAGPTSLRIFNSRGQLVKTLLDASLAGGMHQAVWDGRDNSGRSVSSGLYFYRLQSPDSDIVKKAVLIK